MAYNFKFKWRLNPTKTSLSLNSKNFSPQKPPQLFGPATWIFWLSSPTIISYNSIVSASKHKKCFSHNKQNLSKLWHSVLIVSNCLLSSTIGLRTYWWLYQTSQNIKWWADFVSGYRSLHWDRMFDFFEILWTLIYWVYAFPEELTWI